MNWHRKHLLDIESLSAEDLTTVLDTAREFKAVGERDIKKAPALQGKTVLVDFDVLGESRGRQHGIVQEFSHVGAEDSVRIDLKTPPGQRMGSLLNGVELVLEPQTGEP